MPVQSTAQQLHVPDVADAVAVRVVTPARLDDVLDGARHGRGPARPLRGAVTCLADERVRRSAVQVEILRRVRLPSQSKVKRRRNGVDVRVSASVRTSSGMRNRSRSLTAPPVVWSVNRTVTVPEAGGMNASGGRSSDSAPPGNTADPWETFRFRDASTVVPSRISSR